MTIKTVKYNELLAADMIAGRVECASELKESLIAQAAEIFAEKGVESLDQYVQFRDGLKRELRERGPEIASMRRIFREEYSAYARASDKASRNYHFEEACIAWDYLFDSRASYKEAYRLRRLGKAWSAIAFAKTGKVESV